MKNLTLLGLTLKNFKGVKDLAITPEGKNISICGDNELGKTTIGDSITWLLFDKDMQGRGEKKFSLKTLKADGSEIEKIDHSVEGVFLLDGKKITLKKILKENWPKKRGSAKKVFTGHTTEHRIDGLKVSARKYKSTVEGICAEKTFQMLMVPHYFASSMKWQDRRMLLFDVCGGDVSDSDVITGSKELTDLSEILGDKTAEEMLPHLKEQRTNIDEQIESIPIRIDENSRKLPDISEIDQKAESKAVVSLGETIAEKEKALDGLDSGGAGPELTQNLADAKAKITGLVSDANSARTEKITEKRDELSNLKHACTTADLELKTAQTTCSGFQSDIDSFEAKLVPLREIFTETESSVLDSEEGFCCSECTQVVPVELQKSIFLQVKNANLGELNAEGTTLTDGKTKAEESLAAAIIEAEKAEHVAEEAAKKVTVCTTELDDMERAQTVTDSIPGYKEAAAEKEKIEGLIEKAETGNTTELSEKLKGEIDGLKADKAAATAKLNLVDDHVKIEKRNDELKGEESGLAEKYEEIESHIFLIEKFFKVKAEMLAFKIAPVFGDIKFKLFKEAINGGVEQCCEVLVKNKKGVLVPYHSANKAGQMNSGLAIINVLSNHYDVQLPIVVDNAEAVNVLGSAGSQIIRLVVTKDESLTVVND